MVKKEQVQQVNKSFYRYARLLKPSFNLQTIQAASTLIASTVLCFGLTTPPALAQTNPVAEIAMYNGPDREQKLLKGAQKEGQLTLYTSLENSDATKIKEAFEKKYGIKITLWRSGSDAILHRVLTETRANRYVADVIETNGIELEAGHREKLLQQFQSPYLADLIPQAIRPHHEWVSTRMHLYTVGYNTNLIKKEDLPKAYKDLLDPKYKGKIGIEATNYAWFATVVNALGEKEGLQLFKDIVKTNGISVRKGHNLLANLVASGEVPMALTINNQAIGKLKKNGAPIDGVFVQFGVGMLNGIALQRNAPNPHAAMLFIDFMLSDGQAILRKLGREATARQYQIDNGVEVKMIDINTVLDHHDKWDKLYQDIVVAPANQ